MENGDVERHETITGVCAFMVIDIMDNYKIGKKPLAKLLGWGESTIIRYLEGDVPNNEYSDKLRAIHESPNLYFKILIDNKDKITDVAFKKSRKAVLNILMHSKMNMLAQYMINQLNGDINIRMIQVILYYSQVVSLVVYNKELFQQEVQFTCNMMPYLELYENMRANGIQIIELDSSCLIPQEKYIVDTVMDAFSWYGPRFARTLVLKEKEEGRLFSYVREDKKISNDSLLWGYKKVFEGYQMNVPEDFKAYISKRVPELITDLQEH